MSKDLDVLTAEEETAMKEMGGVQTEETETSDPTDREPSQSAGTDDEDKSGQHETADDGTSGDASEAEDSGEKSVKKQPTVPHAKFHAERERRKQLEAELNHLRASANQPPPPQQTAMDQPVLEDTAPRYVDPIVDPDGYRQWAEYQMRLPLLEQQRIQAQQQADQEVRQTFERIAHYEQEMQETEPDYFEAVDWIREQRTEALYDAGYTDDEVQRQLLHDVYDLVKSGEQAGINPARLLYMQCLEAGFVPSGNAGQEQSATDGGDQAKQRINTLNKAQKNAQGVTNTGEAQAGQLTLKAAAAMNENDFSKLGADEVERLLSGG